MTNVQAIIVAAAIIAAGLMASGSPQAQSQPAGSISGSNRALSTAYPSAWFVINDEVWFCKESDCKKTDAK